MSMPKIEEISDGLFEKIGTPAEEEARRERIEGGDYSHQGDHSDPHGPEMTISEKLRVGSTGDPEATLDVDGTVDIDGDVDITGLVHLTGDSTIVGSIDLTGVNVSMALTEDMSVESRDFLATAQRNIVLNAITKVGLESLLIEAVAGDTLKLTSSNLFQINTPQYDGNISADYTLDVANDATINVGGTFSLINSNIGVSNDMTIEGDLFVRGSIHGTQTVPYVLDEFILGDQGAIGTPEEDLIKFFGKVSSESTLWDIDAVDFQLDTTAETSINVGTVLDIDAPSTTVDGDSFVANMTTLFQIDTASLVFNIGTDFALTAQTIQFNGTTEIELNTPLGDFNITDLLVNGTNSVFTQSAKHQVISPLVDLDATSLQVDGDNTVFTQATELEVNTPLADLNVTSLQVDGDNTVFTQATEIEVNSPLADLNVTSLQVDGDNAVFTQVSELEINTPLLDVNAALATIDGDNLVVTESTKVEVNVPIVDINGNVDVSGMFDGHGAGTFHSTLQMGLGVAIDEFSDDINLSGDSNTAIPTEHAVKTYIDTNIAAENLWDRDDINGYLYPVTLTDRLGVGLINPSVMFEVLGDAKIDGDMEVTGNMTILGSLSTVNETVYEVDNIILGTEADYGGVQSDNIEINGFLTVRSQNIDIDADAGAGLIDMNASNEIEMSAPTIDLDAASSMTVDTPALYFTDRLAINRTYFYGGEKLLVYNSSSPHVAVFHSGTSSSEIILGLNSNHASLVTGYYNSGYGFATIYGNSPSASLVIKDSSNVCIGSLTEHQKFNVSGSGYFSERVLVNTTSTEARLNVLSNNINVATFFTTDPAGEIFIGGGRSGNDCLVTGFNRNDDYGYMVIYGEAPGLGLNILDGGNVGVATITAHQKFNVNGGAYISGNLGVGTTTMTGRLSVNSGGGQVTAAFFNSNSNWNEMYVGTNNSGNQCMAIGYNKPGNYGYMSIFGDSPGSALAILDGGNVAVGTTTATEKFSVSGNAFVSGNIYGTDAVSQLGGPSNRFNALWMNSGIDYKNNLDFNWNNTGTTRMRLTTSGWLGLGDNTTPLARLHLKESAVSSISGHANANMIIEKNTHSYIQFTVPASVESGLIDKPEGYGGNYFRGAMMFADGRIKLRTGGNPSGYPSDRVVIESNGHVGILTTANYPLDVNGTIYSNTQVQAGQAIMADGSSKAIFGSNAVSTPILIARNANDSGDDLYVSSTGYVGVNTVVPKGQFDIADGTMVMTKVGWNHGMTSVMDASIFSRWVIEEASSGGLQWTVANNNGTRTPLRIQGIIGSADPTDTVAAITLEGGKANGTTQQALGNIETVLQVRNLSNNLATILGNGSLGLGIDVPTKRVLAQGSTVDGAEIRTQLAGAGSEYERATFSAKNDGSALISLASWGSTAAGNLMSVSKANLVSLWGGNGSGMAIGTDDATPLTLGTNDSARITVLADGKVGVMTQLPGYAFDVSGDINTKNSGDSYRLNGHRVLYRDGVAYYIGGVDADAIPVHIRANNIDAIKMDASGNVEIPGNLVVRGDVTVADISTYDVDNLNFGDQSQYGGALSDIINMYGYVNIKTQRFDLDADAGVGIVDIDATGEVELTAPTIDINGSTIATIDTPSLDINATATDFSGTVQFNSNVGFWVAPDGTYTLKVANNGMIGGDGNITFGGAGHTYIRAGGANRLTLSSSGVLGFSTQGVSINEFSNDGTMAGNSDLAVPTEKAIVTYISDQVGFGTFWQRIGTVVSPKLTGDNVAIGQTAATEKLEVNGNIKYYQDTSHYTLLSWGSNEMDITAYNTSASSKINFRQQHGATNRIRVMIDEYGNLRVIDSNDTLKYGQLAFDSGDFLIRTETNLATAKAIKFVQQDSGGSDTPLVIQADGNIFMKYDLLGTDGVSELGGPSNRFNNLWMSSNIDFSNALNFNSGGSKRMEFGTDGSMKFLQDSDHYGLFSWGSDEMDVTAYNASGSSKINFRQQHGGTNRIRATIDDSGNFRVVQDGDPLKFIQLAHDGGNAWIRTETNLATAMPIMFFQQTSAGNYFRGEFTSGGNLQLYENMGIHTAADGTYTLKIADNGVVGADGNLTFGGGGETYLRAGGTNRVTVATDGRMGVGTVPAAGKSITVPSGGSIGNTSGSISISPDAGPIYLYGSGGLSAETSSGGFRTHGNLGVNQAPGSEMLEVNGNMKYYQDSNHYTLFSWGSNEMDMTAYNVSGNSKINFRQQNGGTNRIRMMIDEYGNMRLLNDGDTTEFGLLGWDTGNDIILFKTQTNAGTFRGIKFEQQMAGPTWHTPLEIDSLGDTYVGGQLHIVGGQFSVEGSYPTLALKRTSSVAMGAVVIRDSSNNDEAALLVDSTDVLLRNYKSGGSEIKLQQGTTTRLWIDEYGNTRFPNGGDESNFGQLAWYSNRFLIRTQSTGSSIPIRFVQQGSGGSKDSAEIDDLGNFKIFGNDTNEYGLLGVNSGEFAFLAYKIDERPEIYFRQQRGGTGYISAKIDQYGNFRLLQNSDEMKYGQLAHDSGNFWIRTETNNSACMPIMFHQQNSGGNNFRGEFNSTGNFIVYQNMAIQATPDGTYTLKLANNALIGTDGNVTLGGGGETYLRAGGSNKVFLQADGDIGFGIQPTSQVHLYRGSGDVFYKWTSGGGGNEGAIGNESGGTMKLMNLLGGGSMAFQTGGSVRLTIQADGKSHFSGDIGVGVAPGGGKSIRVADGGGIGTTGTSFSVSCDAGPLYVYGNGVLNAEATASGMRFHQNIGLHRAPGGYTIHLVNDASIGWDSGGSINSGTTPSIKAGAGNWACKFFVGGSQVSYIDASGTYHGNLAGTVSNADTVDGYHANNANNSVGSALMLTRSDGTVRMGQLGINAAPVSGIWCGAESFGWSGACTVNAKGGSLYLYGNGVLDVEVTSSGTKFVHSNSVQSGNSSYTTYGPNSTWGGYLRIGAFPSSIAAGRAEILTTDGNLHLDCATSKTMYLNYYSQRPVIVGQNSNTTVEFKGSIGVGVAPGGGKSIRVADGGGIGTTGTSFSVSCDAGPLYVYGNGVLNAEATASGMRFHQNIGIHRTPSGYTVHLADNGIIGADGNCTFGGGGTTYLRGGGANRAYVNASGIVMTSGNFHGYLVGNISGSSTSCSGNSATATYATSAGSATNATNATNAGNADTVDSLHAGPSENTTYSRLMRTQASGNSLCIINTGGVLTAYHSKTPDNNHYHFVGENNGNNTFLVKSTGQVSSDYSSTMSVPADVAEWTKVDGDRANYPEGTVVQQSDTPLHVRIADEFDEVYGVVTNRGTFCGGLTGVPLEEKKDKDGFILEDEVIEEKFNAKRISMTGHILLRVVGKVQIGKKLTLSDIPGVARQVASREEKLFAFAISRESYDGDGEGLIEVRLF